jgi:hypothetical protein
MARGGPDVLDVGRSEHLLTGGEPLGRRLLLPAEVRFERLHPRGGEQHAGVIARGNEGRGRHTQVPLFLEEREESLANLGGRHRPGV